MIRRFTSRSGNQSKQFVSPPLSLVAKNPSFVFLKQTGITLLVLLLSLFFAQNRLQAQCDIAYTGSQMISLSLDEFGSATINPVLFESYVSSSSASCHPNGGGTVNLYEDASKNTPFLTTNYNCTDTMSVVNLFVALMNSSGGESAAIPFEVTIVDAFSPNLVCPFNVTRNLETDSCSASIDNIAPMTASDNCNGMVLTYDITGATIASGSNDASGTSFNPGVSTVTYSTTDATGNTNTCSSTVTISFPQSNNITGCSSNTTLVVDASCTATLNYPTPSEINGCSVTFTAATTNVAANMPLSPGSYPIAFTFNNGTDNIPCNFTITVQDNEEPTINIPNQSITTTGCQANYSYVADANDIMDNCVDYDDLIIGWTLSGGNTFDFGMGDSIPNQLLSVGDYAITFTARDTFNNIASHTYTLSVIESAAPTAVVMDITTSLDINGNVIVNAEDLDAGSSDNCSAITFQIAKDISPTDTIPDSIPEDDWLSFITYDCTDLGASNPVVFRVLDATGNISDTLAANITIEDDLAPVAMCQDTTVIIVNGTSVTVNASSIDNGSTDNCANIVSYEITIDEDNDETFEIGYASSYTVSCPSPTAGFISTKLRVTDDSGESAECIAKINVQDGTAPDLIGKDVTASLDAMGLITVNATDFDDASTEDCDTIAFTFAESQTGAYLSSRDYDCSDIGTINTIYLKGTNSTGLEKIIGPLTLIVQDTISPTVTCVSSLTVSYNAAGVISVPAASLDSISTDNCNVTSKSVSATGAAGSFSSTFIGNCSSAPANLILQVSDGVDSTATCVVPITVEDNIPPTAVCNSNLSVAIISDEVIISATQIDGGSADACSGLIANLEVARVFNDNVGTYGDTIAFGCDDVPGTMQMVRLRVTDDAGLTSTCNSFIDVQETQPPVFGSSFPSSPQVVECATYSNNVGLPFDTMAENSAVDNCGTVEVTFNDSGTPVTNACSNTTIIRTYTATDSEGNSSTMSVTISVRDTTAPTFVSPADIVIECDGTEVLPDFAASGGESTGVTDICDESVATTFETYHGYFDFKEHNEVSPAHDFSPAAWTASPASRVEADMNTVELQSSNNSTVTTHYTINIPADGLIAFDYSTVTNDAPEDDKFGYTLNGIFESLEPASSPTRVIVEVANGDVFRFSQESADGEGGSALTTVSNFTFVDTDKENPESLDCANNFDIARVWSLEDCAGNEADDQFQRISIRDETAPVFDYSNNLTVFSSATSCVAFVDLNMGEGTNRLIEACSLVSVTNTALADYGKGNGTDNASGNYTPGEYTVTFTAVDACNDPVEFTVNFTVEDNTNPTVSCQDLVNVTIPSTGTATLSPNTVIASVSDNCALDNSSFTLTQGTFTNDDFGLNTVTLSVSDVNGNTTTCNSVVDVMGSVEYDVAEVEGVAGSTINLPVLARHFTNVNSFSMTVNLADPSVATIVDVTDFHPSLSGLGQHGPISPDQVEVSYIDGNTNLPDLDDVVLFNVRIQFNPLASSGDITAVSLSDILTFRDDAAGNPQSVSILGFAGSAEVAAGSSLRTISGNIRTITSPTENIDSVTVNLTGTTGNSMITTTDGNYTFDVSSGSTQTVTPYKNTNWRNGGNVNIVDVLKLHRLQLGLDAYTSTWQEVASDSDGDNSLTILDVLLAHRISLSNIESIPSNTSWRFVDAVAGVPAAPLSNGFAEEHSYPNITTDVTDADFLGIKICNVVGAASGQGLVSDSADERDAPLYFKLDNFVLEAGEDYAVEVKAKDFNYISAYQYNLLFNPEYAQLNNITPGAISNMSLDNFNTLNSATGVIRTDWYELHPMDVADETVLFTLNFTATQGGIQLSEILSIDAENELAFHADGNNEVGEVALEFNTTTAVTPVAENTFVLGQNKPNPFSSETIISFVLPENAETTLTIIDVAGKVVFQTKTQAQKGYNELKIKASDLASTGVFHYRLDSEVGTAVRKMVILR